MPSSLDSATTPLSRPPHFDPRTAPVVGIDVHLPPVPAAGLTPEALRTRFRSPPAWRPEISVERKMSQRPLAAASVLVAIVARDKPMVILTERTTHLSTHSGQVAFPGGKRDDGDSDAAQTALREAHEEIGLDHRFVDVIGEMPTYTTGTGFIITPVVALVRPEHVLKLNAYEVADAFEVPLEFLMNPSHHHRHTLDWEGVRREWISMPYMDGTNTRFIWGATAAMLRNLYRFLAA